MFRRQKGSLTVEAALALPIFMAAILFISFTIKAYYVQDAIQDALTEAVTEASAMCYPYALTGTGDYQDGASEKAVQRQQSVNGDLSQVLELTQTLETATQNKENHKPESKLKQAFSTAELLTPEDFLEVLKEVTDSKDTKVAEQIITEKIMRIQLGNALAADGKNVIAKLENMGIDGGLEGFDFKGSEYFLNGDTFDVQVQYHLKKLDPFGLIKNVSMKSRVVCKAWLGGVIVNGDGEYQPVVTPPHLKAEETNDEAQEVLRTCYIILGSETSTKYHLENCSSLREKDNKNVMKTVVPISVPFIKNGELWEPKDEEISYNNRKYDFCENCHKGEFQIKQK